MLLGEAIKRITTSKSVPDRLKPPECERSPEQNTPSTPYILEKDTIQDPLVVCTMKITLPDKVQLNVVVFNQLTPQPQTALETMRQK
jgi:hypothetical protein